MRLHFLDRSSLKDSSFTVKHSLHPYFLNIWHYHPELELVLINKSTGTKFIGDSIERFKKGELVLIGPNLPHMWLNDKQYFTKPTNLVSEAYAIHFRKDFLGTGFFQSPELKHIDALIFNSNYGIRFIDVAEEVNRMIKDLSLMEESFERLMLFLTILNYLAQHKKRTVLASEGYLKIFRKSHTKAMNSTYEYIFNNFTNPISLNDVANIAHMNPSAFSRFFKKVNRKTFKEYLNEIRIGYARKLLVENQYNITRICYESGFNNVSNFNRQFKKITGKTPSQYLKQRNAI